MSHRAWRSALVVVLCAAAAVQAAPPAPGKHGRTRPPAHAVSRDRLAQVAARLAGGASLVPVEPAAADSVRLVALRVEFPDLAFGESPPRELHDRFYFETQFAPVAQYFATASFGLLDLRVDVADVVVRAARPQAEYGGADYDSLMVALTREAVQASDGAVDFARYAGVVLVHAGPGQESDVAGDSPSQIWSGFLDDGTFREQLSSPDSVVEGIPTGDGVRVRNVVVLPEWQVQDLQVTGGTRLGSLGVYAHEIGQWLGMIPLFDATPSPVPDSQGVGNFDLMAYGLWVANGFIPSLPSTFNRMLMGWIRPLEVPGDTDFVLRDQERGPADSTAAVVRVSEREYFLVSYVLEDPDGPIVQTCDTTTVGPRRFFRFDDRNGNCIFDYTDTNADGVLSPGDDVDTYAGAEWDFFLTDLLGSATAGEGAGLLVLHVDEEVLQEVLSRGSTNVEGDARRKAVDVEEADGIEDLDRAPDNPRAFGSAEDYFGVGRVFGPDGVPDTRSTNGAPTGIRIVLVAYPDSAPSGPGPRAAVRVTYGASSAAAAAPRPLARRSWSGTAGSDLVALPLGDGRAALVVPADSGLVFLADASLDEAPVADGDPATLRPWVTLPPALAGTWVGPPAVGDVDGDGAPDVVLAALGDSAGAPQVRLFGWRRDGRELRDLDANPATNTGLLASFPGTPSVPLLFDFEADGRQDVVLVARAGQRTQAHRFATDAGGVWDWQRSDLLARPPVGGPIIVRLPAGTGQRPAVAMALYDSSTAVVSVEFETFQPRPPYPGIIFPRVVMPRGRPPIQLAAGNLDGTGADELVLASADGHVGIVTLDDATGAGPAIWTAPESARFAAVSTSPIAFADIDGNGTLEVLVASESEMHVLSATGAAMHGWPYRFAREPALEREPEPGGGAGSPLVVDLDADERPDILLHLPGGALLVWDARGARRRDLEAALPARAAGTPLLADLDGAPGLELAAAGRFDAARRYLAGPDSLVTTGRSELAVWSLPAGGDVAWGELGGGPGHAFFDGRVRDVPTAPNDPQLASFVVGPNPASSELRARVALTAVATVRCRVFDLEGECVREATRTGLPGTIVEFGFDVRGLASGIYLTQLELSTGGRRTRPVAVRR